MNVVMLIVAAFISNWTFLKGAVAQTKLSASGIFALTPTNDNNLASKRSWTNQNISGVVIRTDWGTVQPAIAQYNWSLLDTGVALGQSHNKKIIISVDAGSSSPSWIYAAGAKPFRLTHNITMPNPWDPVYQSYWSGFLTQLAARYDSNIQVVCVTMAGPGSVQEYFFAETSSELKQLAAAGGSQIWVNAANQITDSFAKAFLKTPFFCATGVAVSGSKNEMTAVLNYGFTTYPGRFGIQSNALQPSSPTSGNFPHTNLNMSGLSPMGLQMLHTANNLSGTLGQALTAGILMGADFIEVYESDCENPAQQSVIGSANQLLLTSP